MTLKLLCMISEEGYGALKLFVLSVDSQKKKIHCFISSSLLERPQCS